MSSIPGAARVSAGVKQDMNKLTFVWDDYFWISKTKLKSWEGFKTFRAGSRRPSDGTVQIVFAPEGRGGDELDTGELRLIDQFVKNEPEISKSALAYLAREYPKLQSQYCYSGTEKKEKMPDVRREADLRSLVCLHTLNIHQIADTGAPYVGYQFHCTWDEEHGLGILMHGTRPVEVGGADTAILLWVARKDAEKHA